MLERYFVKPATVDRIRASWIGGAIEQYIGWLSEQGYAARNVFRRVPILVQFGAFAAERGARRLDELPGYIDGFVAEWLRVHSGKSGPDACRKIASAARSRLCSASCRCRLSFEDHRRLRRTSVFRLDRDLRQGRG